MSFLNLPFRLDDVAEPVDVQRLGQFVAGALDDEGVVTFLEEDAEALDILRPEAAGNAPLLPVVAVDGLEFFDDERQHGVAEEFETFVER